MAALDAVGIDEVLKLDNALARLDHALDHPVERSAVQDFLAERLGVMRVVCAISWPFGAQVSRQRSRSSMASAPTQSLTSEAACSSELGRLRRRLKRVGSGFLWKAGISSMSKRMVCSNGWNIAEPAIFMDTPAMRGPLSAGSLTKRCSSRNSFHPRRHVGLEALREKKADLAKLAQSGIDFDLAAQVSPSSPPGYRPAPAGCAG
jgi:hypothetical protein